MISSGLAVDLRTALRRLVQSPGFTFAALLTLALGVGANTAVFSVLNALLWRPLPGISDPGRLVDIARTERGRGADTFGYVDYTTFRDHAHTLAQVFAYDPQPLHVRVGGGTARRAFGFSVTANYFEALGVQPSRGRFFLPEEDSPAGGAPVAVASEEFFRRELGADPAAVGRPLSVNGQPFTLIGVAPAGFSGHVFGVRPELFVPITAPLTGAPGQLESLTAPRSAWLVVGARLAPGATLAAARAELSSLMRGLAATYPDSHGERGVLVLPAAPLPSMGRGPLTTFSTLLFLLVGSVLAIACANVAAMLLARGEPRLREIALRQALGASRTQIVRQLLTETLLLFGLAALPGVLLARWGVDLLRTFRPPAPVPLQLDFPLDLRVLVFALGLALGTGLLFGLAPALQAARRDPLPALRDQTGSGRPRRLRLRTILVAGQLALSLLLLISAGLMVRALATARAIDPGFDAEGVTTWTFDLGLGRYETPAAQRFLDDLVAGARGLPGVESAATARVLPLSLTNMGLGGVVVAGVESPAGGFEADANIVSPGYFGLLRLPITGRDFGPADREGAPRVAIVNDFFARRFWPNLSALGQRFELASGEDRQSYEVVGVAAASKLQWLGEAAQLAFWLPQAQTTSLRVTLLVRHAPGAPTLAPAIATLFRELDPNVPTGPATELAEVTAVSTLPQRIGAAIGAGLGAIGLLLAGLGLYGVLAYFVAQRTREIGIRMALGASRSEVLRLVARQAAGPVAVGMAVGLVVSLAASRLLASLLYGLSPTDLATFVGVPALLAGIAVVATWLPTRQALAVEPARALRHE